MSRVARSPVRAASFSVKSLVGACSLLSASLAFGSVTQTNAVYEWDSTKPGRYKFVNPTLDTGVCATDPSVCQGGKYKSATLEAVTGQTPHDPGDPDPRNHGIFGLDSSWKTVTFSNGADTIDVRFRIAGIQGWYATVPDSAVLTGVSDPRTAHAMLWDTGGFDTAPSPCIAQPTYNASTAAATFIWMFPETRTECVKFFKYNAEVKYAVKSVIYEIDAPALSGQAPGRWTASRLTYITGDGKDIDLGNKPMSLLASASFDFALEVQAPPLKVTFPPGSDKLALQPAEGWSSWVGKGRQPTELQGTLDYQLQASGSVEMKLMCQYTDGAQCAIQNSSGLQVPVKVEARMPMGYSPDVQLLRADASVKFDVLGAVDERASLKFSISKTAMTPMLNHSGTKFEGTVTIVWDAI